MQHVHKSKKKSKHRNLQTAHCSENPEHVVSCSPFCRMTLCRMIVIHVIIVHIDFSLTVLINVTSRGRRVCFQEFLQQTFG